VNQGTETHGVRIATIEKHLHDAAEVINRLVQHEADRRVEIAELRGQVLGAAESSHRTEAAALKISGSIDDWFAKYNGRLRKVEVQTGVQWAMITAGGAALTFIATKVF